MDKWQAAKIQKSLTWDYGSSVERWIERDVQINSKILIIQECALNEMKIF